MMRRGERSRRGLTLVEVLMVMLIICFVMSLIVPGVLAGRQTAEQIQCLNNMRQVALAIQNYVQQHGCLPPGVINPTGPIRHKPEGLHHGWLITALPYMEQAGLSGSIDPNVSVYSAINAAGRGLPLRSLHCPSDKSGGKLMGVATSSYAGCHHDVEAPIDADNHGVLFLNSHVTYDDITDGSSFTIFFGEKLVDAPDLGWLSGTRATLRNTGTPINGKTVVSARAMEKYSPGVLPVGGFGSLHRGGANMSFGDGAVRFVRQSIHPEVLQRLGHRSDGEPIGGDDF